jgi:glycerophosphoryl diester phosphodiesterase
VDSSLFSYIAHRGLHDDKVPENSIAAFKAASSASLAIETDVHLTKDKRLVISHDSSLEGFGKIESNTLEDIQEGYHLSNGEKLPSFQEMLSEVPDEKMIVLELKIPDGTSGEGIAKALLKETEGMDLSKKMVVVSFNLEALSALSDSQFNRGLLVSGDTNLDIYTSKSAESITTSFCEFYDVAYTLLNRSESLSYRERGGKLIGWTFTSQGSVNSYKNVCDGYTFEGFSPSK